jgi:glycosyltransferase involved in cell wall biosynthesis
LQTLHKPLHIFAIASILPNKYDGFIGDFILRHNIAIARRHQVLLVCFIQDDRVNGIYTEVEQLNQLTIHRVYTNENKINTFLYYSRILKIFKKARQEKPFDLVHAHIHWRAGAAAYLLHKVAGIPYVLTEHLGYLNQEIYPNELPKYPALKSWLSKRAFENALACMPVSNYLAKHISIFAPQAKCRVVANVVDTNAFCYQASQQGDKFVFVNIASASLFQKNTMRMLDGIAMLMQRTQDFEVHIYMPENNEVRHRIKALKLDSIVLMKSFVPYEALPALLRQTHALLLYSVEETFSCVTAEAHCVGLPCVNINTTAPPELCNAKNAILCDPLKPSSLADAMHDMMCNYTSFDRKAIAAEATARYNYDAIAEQITDVYVDALNSAPTNKR